jgi:hypothetical protein
MIGSIRFDSIHSIDSVIIRRYCSPRSYVEVERISSTDKSSLLLTLFAILRSVEIICVSLFHTEIQF